MKSCMSISVDYGTETNSLKAVSFLNLRLLVELVIRDSTVIFTLRLDKSSEGATAVVRKADGLPRVITTVWRSDFSIARLHVKK